MKFYIDAFASTGVCILCGRKCKSEGGEECKACKRGENVYGSALITLSAKGSFDGYILIELDAKNFEELKINVGSKAVQGRQGKIFFAKEDANQFLQNIVSKIPNNACCLVFLDPEGPELLWKTIEALSKIKRVDMFILYPYDMSLVRLTTNAELRKRLDQFYGTDRWFEIWKSGATASDRRKKLLDFYVENLHKLGFEHVVDKPISTRLREGKMLYNLIYTSHNKTGAKIMTDIFNKELDGQQKMKF